MFIKLSIILTSLCIASAQNETKEWELAVAINDQVEFLNSNGSLLGTSLPQFSQLKALTFDDIRHQFVVSDMNHENDTIYSVHLTKQSDVVPIIQNLPDDVQGLAIDPITDILYWTDLTNKTINFVSLQDPFHTSQVLLQFNDTSPQDIAIDICRRFIYWTNSDISNPSIERATLDGLNREILINDNLFMPTGITIDQDTKRIIWAEKLQGIYYRIASANLNGSQRQVVFEGTHQQPFGIAVDKESIYWTDIINNALWRKRKFVKESPEMLRIFEKNPMGLVTKHLSIKNISECSFYINALENYNGSSTEYFEISTDETSDIECLNRGEATLAGCKCKRGYIGTKCETSVCYNFCVHGNCHLSSTGYPQCRCPVGYMGTRCERNLCDGYCLNNGNCMYNKTSTMGVICNCENGYFGQRCEKNVDPVEICDLFCKEKDSDILIDEKYTFICRCEQGKYKVLSNQDELKTYALPSSRNIEQVASIGNFQEPSFIILSVCLLVMLILIIVLSAFVCKLRRRPRIKKRIIVNKNVTPLTYRPQSNSQQCEITIENCCNMNVCETPCFEPPQLRGFQVSKKDEKKTLLSNMENGEDLY